jgi:hypothetical protein
MSRQINLVIQSGSRHAVSAERALLVLGLALVVLLAYWGYLFFQTAKLGKEAASVAAQITTQKKQLADVKQKLAARLDKDVGNAEIEALKVRSKAGEDLLSRLPNEANGGAQGYAAHMKTLAQISEKGIWLTALNITDGGKKVSLEGRSLRADAVLAYAKRANAQFSPLGVRFTSLELTPPVPVKDGDKDKAAATPVVSFKLF